MKDLNWKNQYSVGVFEIDAEHRIFLKTIKKIYHAFESEMDDEIIKLLLEELYKYADFHFTSEENVMLMNDYPDYKSHKKQHDELIQTLANTINFLDVKKIDKEQLIRFLIQWFKEHTASIDLKLGTYLKESKASHLLENY
ncbi:bacteriohemerythrin [Maribellus maritimus]|uniref:bacteriohemerythrin n=1 Tax=Maribellus maritimus TaxID=2870838 RepID=UPI001EEC97AF|nr:bacteriohemerythrin [Maribellus maritimus]MCG6188887.1 bacteriohemerythrin [Maribellus maritimus]